VTARHWLALVLLLTAVVAYYLPWVSHPSASLSPGARDLAEWTTLLPAMRSGPVPLHASLALRTSYAALAVLVAFQIGRFDSLPIRWALRGLLSAMVFAMLPPVEFLITAQADPNYRQQFFLSIVTLVGLLAGPFAIRSLSVRGRVALAMMTALLVVLTAILGLLWGTDLYQAHSIKGDVGPGIILFAGTVVVLAGETLQYSSRQAA
jgi:hypothetical protein